MFQAFQTTMNRVKKIIAILLLLAGAAHAQFSQPWLIDARHIETDTLLWGLNGSQHGPPINRISISVDLYVLFY